MCIIITFTNRFQKYTFDTYQYFQKVMYPFTLLPRQELTVQKFLEAAKNCPVASGNKANQDKTINKTTVFLIMYILNCQTNALFIFYFVVNS